MIRIPDPDSKEETKETPKKPSQSKGFSPDSKSCSASESPTNPTARFKIIKTLGRGSYGDVVLAENPEGEIVAIKKLEKCIFEKDNKVYQIFNEETIMRKLAHPGIPKLFSFIQGPKMFFFTMEYLSGGEFFDLIKNHESIFFRNAGSYFG